MRKTLVRIGKTLVRVGKWFPRYYREEFQGSYKDWNDLRPDRKAERAKARSNVALGNYTNGTPMTPEDLKLHGILTKVSIGGLALLLTFITMLVTLYLWAQ